jgi:hypothetical protein
MLSPYLALSMRLQKVLNIDLDTRQGRALISGSDLPITVDEECNR